MKKPLLLLASILVTLSVVAISAMDSLQVDGYGVGDYVSDFNLKNVDGQSVSLASVPTAKGYIVVFTCNTCPYAKLYESRIIALDKKYRSKGYSVIAINPNDLTKQPDDSMEKMAIRSKEKGYTFPYLRDDSQAVAKSFGATKTPHVYLLNKEEGNKYRVEFIGAIDDSPREAADVSERYVEDAIDALLMGKKPVVTTKRAIGCTIKWTDA